MLIILGAPLAVFAGVSFYEQDTIVTLDIKTNQATVSGKISSFGGEAINLMVLRPNVTSVSHANFPTDVKDVQSVYSNPDGSFSFIVKMDLENDTLGDYTVIVKNQYAENSITKTFYYSDKNAQANASLAISSADTREKMKQAFTTYYREYGIVGSDFSDMNKWGLIYDYLIANRSSITSIPLFVGVYEMAAALSDISKSTKQDFITNLQKHAALITAPVGDGSDYKSLNANGLSNLSEYMIKSQFLPYTTKEAFLNVFSDGVSLSALSTAGSWKELFDSAVKYKLKLGLDLEGNSFKALGDNGIALLKDMLDVKYNTYSEFKNKYDSLYPKYVPQESNNNKPSNNGGGGGSIPMRYDPVEAPESFDRNESNNGYFNDLSGYEWASEAVNRLYEADVISGKGENRYDPANNVTRAEFIKIALGAFSMITEVSECPFTDVSENDWFYPYIASAYNKGIVAGSDGYANPNDFITREQMFTILKRVFSVLGQAAEITREMNEFSDNNDISDYAISSITELYQAGIINGMPDNMLMPKANATRAEAAVLIYKAMSNN